ncbi:MAG: PD40 domain-containing protein, partial [Alphaproteobacteria bacterium]|nr:PD40 domain-containing protein [Alphaproteobacteria bacterium]
MIKPVLLAAMLATAATAVAQGTPAAPGAVPLIERTKLFGNPFRTQGRLSPDGKWLSWIAPRDGVMNIWVAPAADPSKAKPLTAETTRPIRQHFWAPDSSMVMFVNDKGGDENFLLYGVDVVSGVQRTLTPFEKTRVQIESVSPLVPGSILIGVNNRDPRWHDIHSLDLKTGKLTLVLQNDGYSGFVTDQLHNIRLATKANAAGGTDFFKVENGKIAATPFASTGLDDALTTSPVSYTADGKTLYWVDSRGRDTAALIAEDVATGTRTVIAEDKRADIGTAITNPVTGKVEGYSVYYLRNEWRAVDPAIKGDLDFLKAQLKGDFSVTSRTQADDRWLVSVDPVTAPTATYLYDLGAKKLTRLFVTRPEL